MNSLIRFSPGSELRRMQHEFDRLFNGFFPTANGNSRHDASVWSPRVDLAETNDAYVIQLDAPGIDKKDIAINFQDGTLTISGERKAEEKTDEKTFVRVERSYGRFSRSFSVPNGVKSDKIKASYTDGVLSIHVPKAEEVKPVQVKIS